MSDFYYDFAKKHFDAELLFTHAGSLTYERKSEDVYENFFKHKHQHLFDFNNFQKALSFMIIKIKVVNKGIPINKFVA